MCASEHVSVCECACSHIHMLTGCVLGFLLVYGFFLSIGGKLFGLVPKERTLQTLALLLFLAASVGGSDRNTVFFLVMQIGGLCE